MEENHEKLVRWYLRFNGYSHPRPLVRYTYLF
jgi:hypothetical protein